MKLRISVSIAAMIFAVWAVVQTPAPRSLTEYVPAGPLLCVEAMDFGALLRDWNGSAEKQAWLKSANYEVFSRSRLFQRFEGTQSQFAAAAGLPPNMPFLESVAGGETALAIYDIGKLEFFYITRLATARAIETLLWKTRGTFETRHAAGVDYFVRMDVESKRVAAFAAANDYLLVATREDLIPEALKLLGGAGGSPVTREEWFAAAVKEAGPSGDLRMVLNIPQLVESPHFRSYWVQRNVSTLEQYGAGVSDVVLSPGEVREQRLFLRFAEVPPTVQNPALGQVLRLAPEDAGFYRAWANPAPAAALALVASRVIAPQAQVGRASEAAPEAPVSAAAGNEGDLETRIDEPPLVNTGGGFVPDALRGLLANAKLEAMLEVGGTRTADDGVFVGIDSAVAFLAATEWNATAVHDALATAAETGPLGRIAFEARGRILIIGNSAALVHRIAGRIASAPKNVEADYAAEFDAARERPNFEKLTRMIDYAATPDAREPRFFSDNLASFGRTLGRATSASIVVRDRGRAVTQTVIYRLAP